MNTIFPEFKEDWERATLFALLIAHGLPPWAEGKNMSKALAAICGWEEKRALNALNEAVRRGMLTKGHSEEDN